MPNDLERQDPMLPNTTGITRSANLTMQKRLLDLYANTDSNVSPVIQQVLQRQLIRDWIYALHSQYENALKDKLHFDVCCKNVNDIDIIDARQVTPFEMSDENALYQMEPQTRLALIKWLETLGPDRWLTALPPLDQGMLIVMEHIRLVFKVIDLSRENRTANIRIALVQDNTKPQQNEMFTTDIAHFTILGENEDYKARINGDSYGMHTLYRLIPHKQLKWNDADMVVWEHYVVNSRPRLGEKNDSEVDLEAIDELINLFCICCQCVNYTIAQAYKSTNRQPRSKTVTEDTAIELGFPCDLTDRIYRTIGGVTIVSDKRIEPVEKRVIRYTKTNWMTRGHIRRLKSGKTVFVRPYESHRHGLNDDGQTARPPVTLELRKE